MQARRSSDTERAVLCPPDCQPVSNFESPSSAPTAAEVPRLTCLDLFCGCGGFTLGMQRAGFHVLAAIDSNPQAVATLRANLAGRNHPELIPVAHALERDLTIFPPADLAKLIGASQVDVIVGGPPCQGFSTVRQKDGANHGLRLIHDPRRHLYREFLRYVEFFQPRLFVMENVLGLRTAVGGAYFTAVQQEARARGYRVHGQIGNAWELGVPQKRRRQLIIGVRDDLPGYFLPELRPAPRAVGAPNSSSARSQASPRAESEFGAPTLWTAIGDLPELRAGGGEDECDCLRAAIGLSLPIALDDALPVPFDLRAANPVAGSAFREFRIQTVRDSLEDGDVVVFTSADDPFDEEFGPCFFGIYGIGADGLTEHIADRSSYSEALALAQKLAPGIEFPLHCVFSKT